MVSLSVDLYAVSTGFHYFDYNCIYGFRARKTTHDLETYRLRHLPNDPGVTSYIDVANSVIEPTLKKGDQESKS